MEHGTLAGISTFKWSIFRSFEFLHHLDTLLLLALPMTPDDALPEHRLPVNTLNLLEDGHSAAIALDRLAVTGPGKQQIDFPDAALRFSSRFDGGSMLRVTRTTHNAFTVDLAEDAAAFGITTGYTTWFNFEVRTMARSEGQDRIDNVGREIRLEIANMNGQKGLYANGYSIMFCAVNAENASDEDEEAVERVFDDAKRWKRVSTPLAFEKYTKCVHKSAQPDGLGDLEEGTTTPEPKTIMSGQHTAKSEVKVKMAFTHRFQFAHEKVRFAFCYPYSYSKLQRKLAALDVKHGDQQRASTSIYYHRELLTRSVEGLRVDLLTISSMDGMRATTRDPPRDVVVSPSQPDCTSFESKDHQGHKDHVLEFDVSKKRTVMISARVHPAETPASFMLDGMLDLLLHPTDEGAISLRRHFVFKIIPMLNPDGVCQGFYRTDTRGVNLNRVYLDPSPEHAPSVYAARNLLLRIVDSYGGPESAQAQNSVVYLDLHAHANRRGCFVYGNSLLDCAGGKARQIETQLFARLVGLNTPYFDYLACSFDKANMSRHDLRDNGNATTSREGSSRVALFKATGLTYVYTIECNYNEGRRNLRHTPNLVQQSPSSAGSGTSTPGLRRSSSQSNVNRAAGSAGSSSRALVRHVVSSGGTRLYMKYSPAEWTDVGIGSLVALLDLFQLPGRSKRVQESPFRSLDGVRKSLWAEIKSAEFGGSTSGTNDGTASSTGSGSSGGDGGGRDSRGKGMIVISSTASKRPNSRM